MSDDEMTEDEIMDMLKETKDIWETVITEDVPKSDEKLNKQKVKLMMAEKVNPNISKRDVIMMSRLFVKVDEAFKMMDEQKSEQMFM